MTVKQIKDRFWCVCVFILSWIAFAGDAVAKVKEVAKNGTGDYVCNGCAVGGPDPDAVDCWVCNIFELFFDTGNHVAYTTSEGLISASRGLLAMGLGLWLVFHIMPLVASFKAGNAMQSLTKIGTVLLKAVVVACFLTIGLKPIFDYIISPSVSLAMAVSERMMQSVNAVNTAIDGSAPVEPESSSNTLGEDAKSVFDADVRSGMLGIVKNTFATIDYAQDFAGFLVCESARPYEINLAGIDIGTFPHFDLRLFNIGIIAWVIFGLMSIIFPFYIIDAIFRAILICLLSPLFMVAWVFPATSGYASKAFNVFLGCVVTFVVMGLLVAVGIRIALIPVTDPTHDFMSMCGDDGQLPLIPDLLLSSAQLFPAFAIFICGLIAIKYIKKVADIVGVFGFEKVEGSVGDKLAKGGAQFAMKAAGAAMKVAGGALKGGMRAVSPVTSAISDIPGGDAALGIIGSVAAVGGAVTAPTGVGAAVGAGGAAVAASSGSAVAAEIATKAVETTAKVAQKVAEKAPEVAKKAQEAAKKVKEAADKVKKAVKKAKKAADDVKKQVQEVQKQVQKLKETAGNTKVGKVANKIKDVTDKIGEVKDKLPDPPKKRPTAGAFAKKMVNNIKENLNADIGGDAGGGGEDYADGSDGSDGGDDGASA